MSTLRILHSTIYHYHTPVCFGPHRVVLRPREGHDVHVEEHELHSQPEGAVQWKRDVFGNSIAILTPEGESDSLSIVNAVTVSKRESHKAESAVPVPYPVEYPALEIPVIDGYRIPVYADEADDLAQWAQTYLDVHMGRDAHEIIEQLMKWVHVHVDYRRRDTRGVQTPMETLQLASGSCRDMATLMLEAARAIGITARFASGYLNTRSSEAGRASTHAWVEIYLPEQGWTGWDPTIGERTSFKHITTGVSSHPRGVMPISGSWSGKDDAYAGMDVSVKIKAVPA